MPGDVSTATARTRVGYVLSSSMASEMPSTRIAVANVLPLLPAHGYDPVVLYAPDDRYDPSDPDRALRSVADGAVRHGIGIVYFHRMRGAEAVALAHALRERGVKTVHGVCDFVDDDMTRACDATVSVSEYHKGLHSPSVRHRIHVVHDGIEASDVHKTDYGTHHAMPERPMRAVLLTGMRLTAVPFLSRLPAWTCLTVIGKYAPGRDAPTDDGPGLRLRLTRFLGDPSLRRLRLGLADLRRELLRQRQRRRIPFERRAWSYATVWSELVTFDLAIIPWDMRRFGTGELPPEQIRAKSANRLTQLMAAGLPVVASPVPAYLPIVRQGENGFIARTRREWARAFELLRDPATRERIGRAARTTVLERYSVQRQVQELTAVFDALTRGDAGASRQWVGPLTPAESASYPGSNR